MAAFERASGTRACELCAVVGSPGVGKSRLVAELAETFSDRATVASGRCLPYGETLTWWPLTEALGASGLLAELDGDEHPAIPRAAELLDPKGDPVAPDEAQWALRVVIERLARRQPLVLAVDDLQWADPALLDLLDHLAEAVRDAPLLLLGTARPELFDDRPGMARERRPVATRCPTRTRATLLHRLAGADADRPDARSRILEVAEGNPLFVVELVAMAEDGGEALTDVALPPTIQALLAARLDRLAPDERAVLEARRRRGQGVRARARARAAPRARGRRGARRAGAQGAGRTRRRRASLPPPADPRRRLRGHVQARARGPARAAGADELRLAPRRATAARLPPRARGAAAARARRARTPPRPGCAAASLAAAARRAAQREDAAAAVALLERALALVPDDAHAAARARRRAVRGGPHGATRSRPSTTRSRRASRLRWKARAGVEREFVRLEGDADRGHRPRAARRRRGADRARRPRRRLRAMPRLVAARAGGLVRRHRRARRRGVGGGGALRGARSRTSASWSQILGWRATAAVLGPTPVDGRDRGAARRSASASAQARSRWRADGQPARLAARHAGRLRPPPSASLQRPTRSCSSSTGVGYAVSHHEALVRLLARSPGPGGGRRCVAGLRKLAATDDHGRDRDHGGDARAGAVRAGAVRRPSEQCALARARRRARRHRHAGDLARRAGQALAREPIERRSARDAVALVAGDRPAHPSRRRAAGSRTRAARATIRRIRTPSTALSLYEQKGNAVGAARARSLLGRP